jgi:hypothetical protein
MDRALFEIGLVPPRVKVVEGEVREMESTPSDRALVEVVGIEMEMNQVVGMSEVVLLNKKKSNFYWTKSAVMEGFVSEYNFYLIISQHLVKKFLKQMNDLSLNLEGYISCSWAKFMEVFTLQIAG